MVKNENERGRGDQPRSLFIHFLPEWRTLWPASSGRRPQNGAELLVGGDGVRLGQLHGVPTEMYVTARERKSRRGRQGHRVHAGPDGRGAGRAVADAEQGLEAGQEPVQRQGRERGLRGVSEAEGGNGGEGASGAGLKWACCKMELLQ